jgi:hypothetical protein
LAFHNGEFAAHYCLRIQKHWQIFLIEN